METVCVNLEVLASLRLGEKLRVRHGRFWELYGRNETGGVRLNVPESIMRWWDGSSRHSDFNSILDTFNIAFEKLRALDKDDSPVSKEIAKQLVHRMKESQKGLTVLSRTYQDDVTLCARIRCLQERIQQKVPLEKEEELSDVSEEETD